MPRALAVAFIVAAAAIDLSAQRPGHYRAPRTPWGDPADRLTLVERLTRTAPKTVRWEVRVDDPTTWTKPWTFAMPLTQDDSQPFQAYECHEGNYGVPNILSATRAEEKAAAAARK